MAVPDIPTNVASAINPELINPVEYSHCFIAPFNFENKTEMCITIPYVEGVTWTQFKYSFPSETTYRLTFTFGTESTEIDNQINCLPDVWNNLNWPLPSVNTTSPLRFIVKNPLENIEKRFSFKLVGFMDLFPNESTYFLINNQGRATIDVRNEGNSSLIIGYHKINENENFEITDEDYTIQPTDKYLEDDNYYTDESE